MDTILDRSKKEIHQFLHEHDQPGYRLNQIWRGLYQSYYEDWSQFSNLPKSLREVLSSHFSINPLQLVRSIQSSDGFTEKALFNLSNHHPLEAVLMRYQERTSICVSSQSGCPIGCSFCATGKLGLLRDLSCGEIIAQYLHFARLLAKEQEKITNIVIMGMGEPFLNYRNVKAALHILHDQDGLNVGSRRVTVSTIGIPDKIIQFGEDFPQLNLAVSLHAPTNAIRDTLVPINRRYPIEDILQAVKTYIENTNRRVTFEYVMISGTNDSHEDALQLSRLLHGLLCHVNLIPLNSTDEFSAVPSPLSTIEKFKSILDDHNIPTTIRFSKGSQIQAACGQLAGKHR